MPVPALHTLYRDLLTDPETAAVFSGEAEVAAMLRVEGELARAQGRLGIIPADAAERIATATAGATIAPLALAPGAAVDGVPVPALLQAVRAGAAGDMALQWLHWGATSQDIVDTGLALRLKSVVGLWRARLDAILGSLADLAETHADLALAARTYGQAATPTSFGAVVAVWGRPLLRQRDRLDALTPHLLQVSLSGAAGTLAAMGPRGAEVRSHLAEALGLGDPGHSWHAERDGIASFGQWMAGVTASLAKMGEDLILLTQTGIGEVRLEGAGGSSTMPQKQNPVGPSVLVALARHVGGLAGSLQASAIHRQQRDGAAWFVEWMALPPAAIATGRALALAGDLVRRISPDEPAMARGLAEGWGTIDAEALTFALAARMPRPEAAKIIGTLSRRAMAEATPLLDLVAEAFPGEDWPALVTGPGRLGEAPREARAFAAEARRRVAATPSRDQ